MAPLSVIPKPNTGTLLPFDQYDLIIVSFSGGKDSVACLLHLLDQGVPVEKIELWHQAVDGKPGVAERFFDWPITEAYCKAFAQAFNLPIRFQWRENGFLGEMLKGEIEEGLYFTVGSNAITGYFIFNEDGTVWATRNYYNATHYETQDDAEMAQAMLPPEGTELPRYYNDDEVASLDRKLKKRQEQARGIKDKKARAKALEKADEWFTKQFAPLIMPAPHRVTVATPRPTAQVGFELSEGGIAAGDVGHAGGTGAPGVRLQFPDPVVNLSTRWCSSNLKIDVADLTITNDPRFSKGKFLLITGERRQESNNRAKYAEIETHKKTTKERRVDQWRPVLDYKEEDVWAIMEKWRVRPHPAYFLGWGRLSCMSCIFGNEDQWASIKAIAPHLFDRILHYERRFQKTIQRGGDIAHLASQGTSYVPDDPEFISMAMGEALDVEYVILGDGEEWILPNGAYKKTGGPL